MVASMEKANKNRPRVVIMTQGPEPTIVATSAGNGAEATCELIAVDKVDPAEIVDSNGCGDSFVAAFFGALIRGKSVNDAIKEGNILGGKTLKHRGCVFD